MKAKSIPRKRSKKSKKELKEKAEQVVKQKKLFNIGLSFVLVIVVMITISVFLFNSYDFTNSKSSFLSKLANFNLNVFPQKETPVAVVNQEEIFMAELDEKYNIIPEAYRPFITKQDVLEQIVDEKLLIQEAEANDIIVSDEEIDENIDEILFQNQITMEELETSVESQGLTMEKLREFYWKELLLNKLLEQTIFTEIEITDTDIKDYYFSNEAQMTIPGSANVSHILICHNQSERCVSQLTKEQAFAKSVSVRQITTLDNFGELALEYSDEPAAKVTKGSLGFISEEDPFDPTFLQATFALDEGEISSPIETVFGYHIIAVFEKREAGLLELDTVYEQINQTLAMEQQTVLYNDYIGELRDNADIIFFLDEETQE